MSIYAGSRRNERAMKSGKFPLDPAWLTTIRFYRPRTHFFLINCRNSYVPSTTSRLATTIAGVVSPPQKTASKGTPAIAEPMGKVFPPPYSFQMKEPSSEPITVQGFEGWAPKGFDSRPRIIESGTTTGKPIWGRDPSKQNAWDAQGHVRDRQEGLRMGSHRREAPSHRGPANGLGTH